MTVDICKVTDFLYRYSWSWREHFVVKMYECSTCKNSILLHTANRDIFWHFA